MSRCSYLVSVWTVFGCDLHQCVGCPCSWEQLFVVFTVVLEQCIARVETLVTSPAVDRSCPVSTVVSIATVPGQVLVLYVTDLAEALPGVLWHGCEGWEASCVASVDEHKRVLAKGCERKRTKQERETVCPCGFI